MNQCFVLFAGFIYVHSMCNDSQSSTNCREIALKYTALRQNRQVVMSESRISMEQSMDALSLKDVKVFFLLLA